MKNNLIHLESDTLVLGVPGASVSRFDVKETQVAQAKSNMLLVGMPGASTSHFDMNVAQAPQGPRVKKMKWLPEGIRNWVNTKLTYLFNPKVEAPYSGMNVIKQNLERDTDGALDITIIDYPDWDELLALAARTRLAVIGISVGCENRAKQANALAKELKRVSLNPEVEIVLGNFGAASGKKAGVMDCEEDPDINVLWDDPDDPERVYTGEGVSDLRKFFKARFEKLRIPMQAKPDDPKISLPVPDGHSLPKNPVWASILKRLGLLEMGFNTYNLVVSVGCGRKCDFCNNRFMFGQKETFIGSIEELFSTMEETARRVREEDDIPELLVNLRDENFARPIKNLEKLCGYIRESEENIHFATFGEVKELYDHWKRNGRSFRELARGGLAAIWIGLEAKEDIFDKRGGATPEEVKEMVEDLQSLGIAVIGSFIVGYEGQTKENLLEDIDWSTSLKPATRQVMIHSLTDLVSQGGSNESQMNAKDEEVGHVRKRPHPNFTTTEIEEADREWREQFYLRNGPSSISALITIWNGYLNLRDSEDPADVKMATFSYWRVKNYYHQLCIMTMALNRSVFEKHSDEFLQRVAKLVREMDENDPPDNELSRKYEEHHNRAQTTVDPFVRKFVQKGKEKFLRKIARS